MIGSEQIPAGRFMRLYQIEHLEDGKALGRRRRVVDRHIPIAADKRRAPDGSLQVKIGEPKQPSRILREARHFGGDGAFVKAGPAKVRDRLQRIRQIWICEPSARRRRCTAREEERSGFALSHQIVPQHLDEARKPPGDRKTVARVRNRAFEHAGKRQPPAGFMRLGPTRDRARHRQGGRDYAPQRNLVQPSLLQRRERRAACGLAAAVEVFDLAGPGVVNEPERVAAQSRHVRIDHRQHGAGSDRSIDGRATRAQHVDAGRGRQRMRRGHDATRRERDGTPGTNVQLEPPVLASRRPAPVSCGGGGSCNCRKWLRRPGPTDIARCGTRSSNRTAF